MGYITKYGSIWGQIPQSTGRVLFVAPSDSYTVEGRAYSASNDNDGLSPERAVRTLARAVALATDGANDVIVLLPGSHTTTASVALSKSAVTIMGLPSYRSFSTNGRPFRQRRTTLTTSASDEIINVTAADCAIANLEIIPVTQQVGVDFSAAAHRFHVVDCSIDMETPAVHTSTVGIKCLGAAEDVTLENIYVACDGAQGNAFDVTASLKLTMTNCILVHTAGTWASTVLTGAGTSGCLIDRCEWVSYGTAVTVGVNGTGATIARGVEVRYCNFGNLVTVPVDNYDANEATLVEVYKAGVGATDGGTKVVAIT